MSKKMILLGVASAVLLGVFSPIGAYERKDVEKIIQKELLLLKRTGKLAKATVFQSGLNAFSNWFTSDQQKKANKVLGKSVYREAMDQVIAAGAIAQERLSDYDKQPTTLYLERIALNGSAAWKKLEGLYILKGQREALHWLWKTRKDTLGAIAAEPVIPEDSKFKRLTEDAIGQVMQALK